MTKRQLLLAAVAALLFWAAFRTAIGPHDPTELTPTYTR
jgi:hypothetical protein